jgi:formylglycine-generating enzyme required for sulfatase activity
MGQEWKDKALEQETNPENLLEHAQWMEGVGDLFSAASFYDRAYGLAPLDEKIRVARQGVLDKLALVENGLAFRFVPGGPFLMGNDHGEWDERPLHRAWLSAFWISETPISWADYCRLMDWEPPPVGCPRVEGNKAKQDFDEAAFAIYNENKIRLQYCEDKTVHARDWHAHAPGQLWQSGGKTQTAQELFGSPQRDDPENPWLYAGKPMVAVSFEGVEMLCRRISTDRIVYSLPTETQWEKAARGGLIAARHSWGDAPPTSERCDFARFDKFSVLPMRTFPPNGYGLYATNGGVWEWTKDWYQADYYGESPEDNPRGPAEGSERVLRGGSWTDCAEVQTVTFRMSSHHGWAPNIGFRLCRIPAKLEKQD